MNVVIAVINRARDFRVFTQLKLQTSGRARAAFDDPYRHARLIFPAETGKELIDDMNNRSHSDHLLIERLERFELFQRLGTILVLRAPPHLLPPNISSPYQYIPRFQR